MRNLFLCTLFLVLCTHCFAQNKDQLKIDSLLTHLTKAKEDTNKVRLLLEIMYVHIYYKAEEGLQYEKPALMLAEKLSWQIGICEVKYLTGKIYWRLNKFDEALKYHFASLSVAEKMNDKKRMIKSLTAIGQDYADHSSYPEALKNFTKALAIARETRDTTETANMYNLISWVYGQQGNYPEASKNTFAALRIAQQLGNEYLTSILLSNIAGDYRALGNDSMALLYLDSSIAPKVKENDFVNLNETYVSIGAIHQEHKNYSKALNYFELALKTGYESKDIQVITKSYSSLAGLYVARGNDTEALKNYLLAVESLKSLEDYQTAAELYIGIGGCYTRLKQYAEAKKYFDDALALSKKIQSESVSNRYYEGVELLDSATGKWKDAYINYKNSVRLGNKLHNDENTKKIMQTTMQYEFDKKEAASKAEQEKKDILQRTIRNSIAGTLAGVLIFLIVVYRQRNKISKARKRSDELLLNILPSEVAEELKDKGSADAKHFDEVTVMFTDFKGFTQISEKLTPAELVAEIHTCFKAFDNIIGKHNIEKIKTIGDSYMCAGGLPVANKTHANDVVKAALEIQQFMHRHLEERKKLGKEIFEIRIGIHTGPVVAGIVGVKKFAYDIWGDTVNIASRMESSGEAGKVNISGSTYEFVKGKFNCVHRGKIQAKNKGEIDMYFVESIS